MTNLEPLYNVVDAIEEEIGSKKAKQAPDNWRDWLITLYPNTFNSGFTQRHIEFWEWVDSIEPNKTPDISAFVAAWPRGGGKTTTAETGVIYLGAKKKRNFVLYVRGTQDKANESIQNIADKLESENTETYYPELASRKVGKYGHSKKWTMQGLRTASGFSVVGIGLDVAVRGAKIEDFRPDLIIFDDIDDKQDTPLKIKKKIETITTSVLPAGATHAAALVVQNLIHDESIVTALCEGTADFLHGCHISGPFPAVENLEYEQNKDGSYTIVSGNATWEGQSIEICENQINVWGVSAFLKEAQHEVEQSGGIWDHIEYLHIDYDDCPTFERGEVWIDPAVTSTDQSDSMGIAAGGVAGEILYGVYFWEQITSPEDVMRRGINIALRYGFDAVGVETDQGGDTWISVWRRVCDLMVDELNEIKTEENEKEIERKIAHINRLAFKQAKAGAGHGSKVHRNSQMMVDYEHGKVYHVRGTHGAIEKALRRFPNKPLDLADTMYWLWYHTIGGGNFWVWD